jgi:hypothetical protein
MSELLQSVVLSSKHTLHSNFQPLFYTFSSYDILLWSNFHSTILLYKRKVKYSNIWIEFISFCTCILLILTHFQKIYNIQNVHSLSLSSIQKSSINNVNISVKVIKTRTLWLSINKKGSVKILCEVFKGMHWRYESYSI